MQRQLLLTVSKRSLRLIIAALPFVVLAVTLLVYPHNARVVASAVSAPTHSIPNVNIQINKQTKIVFSRKKLSCHAQVSCLNITNTTKQTIDLYLNGKLLFSMPPGDISDTNFSFPGTDTFTIPNTNSNAILIVTVLAAK
jgi:hypothetical protein